MGTRSYRQHCGLAAAMDLVGQRWSMLIVRELTPGPRRFTDLLDGLPGIATDVLAERLRELVSAGVLEHRQTRYPTPAKVYSLTERGAELSAIASRLAEWGRPLLPPVPAADTTVRPRWALQVMARAYQGGLPPGHFEFVIDDECLHATIGDDGASIHYGPAPTGPLVRITGSAEQFFAAALAPDRLAEPDAGLAIDGDPDLARDLFAALPLVGFRPDGPEAGPVRPGP